MEKSIMTKKLSLNKPYYKSILTMLQIFQYQQDKSKTLKKLGLTQNQLLFALSKLERERFEKPGNDKKYDELKAFFKRFETINSSLSLAALKKVRLINKNCVKSAADLTGYMDRLHKQKFVEKHGERPNLRYTLNEQLFDEQKLKERIYGSTNLWHFPYLNQIATNTYLHSHLGYPNDFKSYQEKIESNTLDDWILYGFSKDMIDDFSEQEKNELNTWLLNIEKNLSNIFEFKVSKMKNNKKYIEYLKKGGFPMNHLWFKIGFFYQAETSLFKE